MKLKNLAPGHWVSVALARCLILPVIFVLWFLFANDVKASLLHLFDKKSVIYSNVVAEIGDSGRDFGIKYKEMLDQNDRNPGSHYYSIHWPASTEGRVTIKNGSSAVEINTVLSLMGDSDDTYPTEGISGFSVNMGLPPRNNIPHDEARLKFYALLKAIQHAGWKRWIGPGMPRLRGADALRYQMSTLGNAASLMSLDPEGMPSLDEWMKLKDMSGWRFYLNDVYMDVQLMRDRKRMDPNLPGAYFLTLKLESKDSFRRSELAFEDRPRWKELYPDVRSRQAGERLRSEEKLRTFGFNIDVEYRNPDE